MAFKPLEFKIPGEYEYQGVLYTEPEINVDIDMNNNWRADTSDVLIASYPRTGKAKTS